MRKLLACSTLTLAIGLSAAEANAENLNLNALPWSPFAIIGHLGATLEMHRPPLIEGRSAYVVHNPERYTLNNPEGPLNDYYRSSGLSDRLEDCASYGCSGSNGG
jgi:hypothetical protein